MDKTLNETLMRVKRLEMITCSEQFGIWKNYILEKCGDFLPNCKFFLQRIKQSQSAINCGCEKILDMEKDVGDFSEFPIRQGENIDYVYVTELRKKTWIEWVDLHIKNLCNIISKPNVVCWKIIQKNTNCEIDYDKITECYKDELIRFKITSTLYACLYGAIDMSYCKFK